MTPSKKEMLVLLTLYEANEEKASYNHDRADGSLSIHYNIDYVQCARHIAARLTETHLSREQIEEIAAEAREKDKRR